MQSAARKTEERIPRLRRKCCSMLHVLVKYTGPQTVWVSLNEVLREGRVRETESLMVTVRAQSREEGCHCLMDRVAVSQESLTEKGGGDVAEKSI